MIDEIVEEKNITLKAASIITFSGYLVGVVILCIYALEYFVNSMGIPLLNAVLSIIMGLVIWSITINAQPVNKLMNRRITFRKHDPQ